MYINRLLTIEINEGYIKIGVIDKLFKQIYVRLLKVIKTDEIYYNSDISNINKLNKSIKNEISKLKIPCKSISFTIQNQKIFNRKLKIVNTEYEEDILDLIKYELNQFMTLDTDNYVIKHIINKKENKTMNVQAILLPKSIISNYKEIAINLKMKPKKLCINFNVIQNLISQNIINIGYGNNIILEIKENLINMSLINDKKIIESYSMDKSIDILNYIKNSSKEIKYIYFYGIEDRDIIEKLESDFEVKEISLNMNKIEYYGMEDINQFINNIGLIY